MLNLMKMNFYRLFHQKSFYVMIAVAAFISWFMVFMVWWMPRIEAKTRENASQTNEETGVGSGFHVGIVAGGVEGVERPEVEEFNLTDFVDDFFTSGFSMILISVGVPLIVNSERKRGFIKNLGGQMKPRGMLTVAKLPVILFELVVIYAVTVLGFALFGRIYYEQYKLGDIPAMCGAISVQLLLGLAFGALIMLVCTVARSAASGIIAGIIVSSGMFPYVYFLINRFALAYLGAPEEFDISRYALDFYLSSFTSTAESSTMAAAVLAGAVYLLLASALGCLVMEKRDI